MAELPKNRPLPADQTRRMVRFGSVQVYNESVADEEYSLARRHDAADCSVLDMLINMSEIVRPLHRFRSRSCPDMATVSLAHRRDVSRSTQTDLQSSHHSRFQILQNAPNPKKLRPNKTADERAKRQKRVGNNKIAAADKEVQKEPASGTSRLDNEGITDEIERKRFSMRYNQQVAKLDKLISELPPELGTIFELPELPRFITDYGLTSPGLDDETENEMGKYEVKVQEFLALMDKIKRLASLAAKVQSDRSTIIPVWLKNLESETRDG